MACVFSTPLTSSENNKPFTIALHLPPVAVIQIMALDIKRAAPSLPRSLPLLSPSSSATTSTPEHVRPKKSIKLPQERRPSHSQTSSCLKNKAQPVKKRPSPGFIDLPDGARSVQFLPALLGKDISETKAGSLPRTPYPQEQEQEERFLGRFFKS
ncbi:hypothetical protein KVV02_000118 [Mortierella alpina]|uniref:Uncharacterized protein n=1 Tax=Mortierella alpina TaxID=64518 RepID=A0A9P7ZWG8_MORAP|nr:hypothetical protein KVV02_000118 [Mortierella alpina]